MRKSELKRKRSTGKRRKGIADRASARREKRQCVGKKGKRGRERVKTKKELKSKRA